MVMLLCKRIGCESYIQYIDTKGIYYNKLLKCYTEIVLGP